MMTGRIHWSMRCCAVIVILCVLLAMTGCTAAQPQETVPSTTAPIETTQPKQDFSKPLTLNVISGGESTAALLGTYSWNWANEDGTRTAANASGAHPLDSQKLMNLFSAGAETARLEFGDQPEHISVRCWNEECWGDPTAQAETVSMNGYTAQLKSGKYIYEVAAQWDDDGGEYYGTAYYCFYAEYAG